MRTLRTKPSRIPFTIQASRKEHYKLPNTWLQRITSNSGACSNENLNSSGASTVPLKQDKQVSSRHWLVETTSDACEGVMVRSDWFPDGSWSFPVVLEGEVRAFRCLMKKSRLPGFIEAS